MFAQVKVDDTILRGLRLEVNAFAKRVRASIKAAWSMGDPPAVCDG